jgi:hypothetical protein
LVLIFHSKEIKAGPVNDKYRAVEPIEHTDIYYVDATEPIKKMNAQSPDKRRKFYLNHSPLSRK